MRILLACLTPLLILTSAAKILWRRSYRPLIGGPRWLRIHQVLEIYSSGGGRIETDLVPKRPNSIRDMNLLLLGFTVDGLTRIRRFNAEADEELEEIYLKLSALQFPRHINLYGNNCFAYVDHCIQNLNLSENYEYFS